MILNLGPSVSRISLTRKLMLMNALCVVPTVVLLYQVYSTKNEAIEFAQAEIKGNQFQRPLEKILAALMDHRAMTQRAILDRGRIGTEAQTAIVEIEQGIQELNIAEAAVGVDLQFTEEGLAKRKRQGLTAKNISAKWGNLADSLQKDPSSNANELYAGLIADLRGMIAHAGDTSNLILDPDLDSYYLMDVTLLALPQTQDHIQELTAIVDPLLTAGTWLPKDRMQLGVYADRLKIADLDRINGSAQTAFNEDSNFYGTSQTLQEKLLPLLAINSEAMGKLIQALQHAAESDKNVAAIPGFRDLVDRARDSNYILWKASVDELDVLLQKRVEFIANNRNSSLWIGISVLLVTILVSIFLGVRMSRELSALTRELKNSGFELSQIGAEVFKASDSLSSSTQTVAACLEETSASVEQLSSIEKSNATHAAKAASLSKACHESAEQSELEMNRLMQSMNEISQSSKQVEEVIKVIEDIAFQTNLLALNAAVEAARAGEQGKGFAVVAEAVRGLAQRSSSSAKDIKRMIKDSTSRVQLGAGMAQSSCSILQKVVQSVEEIAKLNRVISQACDDQASRLNMINTAVNEIDRSTQGNAASAAQSAEGAEGVARQVQNLNRLVVKLDLFVEGQELETATQAPVNDLKRPGPAKGPPKLRRVA